MEAAMAEVASSLSFRHQSKAGPMQTWALQLTMNSPTMNVTRSTPLCFLCQTKDTSLECTNCDGHLCRNCDEKYHNHPHYPNRQKHARKAIVASSFAQCNCCGSENVEYFCTTCEQRPLFCTYCDFKFHSRQEMRGHVRKQFRHPSALSVNDGIHCCHCHSICALESKECNKSFCSNCDEKYHDHPNFDEHTRTELKDSLEKENRELQNQINTLKQEIIDKETTSLQKYFSQNKEGIWKKCSGGIIPKDGVLVNNRKSKIVASNYYVGRTELDGDLVPGHVLPSCKQCSVFYNGKVHSKSSYEVLVPSSSFGWFACYGNKIPPYAFPGGRTKEGEVLFIGRVKNINGNHTVGKVQASLKGCYMLDVNGDYTIHPRYEILVWK